MDAGSQLVARRFDGNGFRQWKFLINCALRAKGLSSHLTEDEPEEIKGEDGTPDANLEKWRQSDAQAMFIVTSGLEMSQISLIETCTTAKQMMVKLESIYEQKSENTKLLLLEKFHSIKMEGDSIAKHISKIENIAQQLRDAGETVSDTCVITKILGSLPEKYRNLRQAWLSLDEKRQTIVNLTARLIDEEASFNRTEESESTALLTSRSKHKQSSRSRAKCFKCQKRGHYARDCVNGSASSASVPASNQAQKKYESIIKQICVH
ncbi:gag-polypeptide of LTR copia-type domain-containing protein [Phthorimaea operculella]|nr:gag-polypeptide of LTR copia-type domain-containing protein [Phthorimaea operculella]